MGINAIPKNMEKYMAFMQGQHLVFLESFQFMSSSLDRFTEVDESLKVKMEARLLFDEMPKLVAIVFKTIFSLRKLPAPMPPDPNINNLPDDAFKCKLTKKKGVQPYHYMDSFTKFDDKLPEKMISTAFFKMNIYPMSSTNMLKMCGIHPISIQWEDIMICI